MRPVCIIPARGGSKRFPRKNIAPLNGKPLIAYAIEAAVKSQVFETVCVSSDDDEILSVAKKYGADLPLKRPEEFSGDKVQLKQVCLYLLEKFAEEGKPYDSFGLLLPINPFCTADDIRKAYQLFTTKDANYVMSLTRCSHPPQQSVCIKDGYVKSYFGDEHFCRSQDLEPLYLENGSIFFGKTDVFRQEKEFYGSKVVAHIMPPERSVDIDSPLDLKWAEFLMANN